MSDEFTVYVVDDDAGIRSSLAFLFRAAGLRSECHASGAEFLEAHRAGSRGCLIADFFMPGMNGLELQAALGPGAGLPLILISGHADEDLARQALAAGAVAFLQKPLDPGNLIERLLYLRDESAREH